MRNEIAMGWLTGLLASAPAVSVVAQGDRVEYCGTYADLCDQPGRGYTMCERLHAALDAIPATDPLPVCDAALPGAGFFAPGWQELPIEDNLRMVYDIEMYLSSTVQRLGDHNQTTWPDYFPDRFSVDPKNPSTWRRVPYDLWLSDYRSRIQSLEIVPRLSSAVVRLNERGPQKLIKYERIASQCERWMQEYGFSRGGGHIFTAGDDDSPVHPLVGWSQGDMDALVYEGRGVFVSTESGSKGYYVINLLVAMPHDPTNTGRGYAATQRCGLVGIRPTDGVTEFRDGREIARIFVD